MLGIGGNAKRRKIRKCVFCKKSRIFEGVEKKEVKNSNKKGQRKGKKVIESLKRKKSDLSKKT